MTERSPATDTATAPGPPSGPGVAVLPVLTTVALLLHLYPAARLLEGSGLTSGWAAIGIGAPLAVLMVACFIAGHVKGMDRVGSAGDIWLGVIFQLFIWTAIGELLRLVLTLADVPNRGAIVAITVLAVTLGVLAWGMWRALGTVPVVRVEIPISGLHPDLDGLRAVQITDTHLSPLLGQRWLARIVDRVNELDADICFHTGDLADGRVEARDASVGELARVTATDRFYITGNHEYYGDAEHWGRRMTDLGWQFMHNRHVVLRRGEGTLVIAGIDDPTGTGSGLVGHGPHLDAALDGAPPGVPVVLLAHQPKQVRDAIRRDVDLQLAGHTHGGQMWPFRYAVRADQKYVSGLYRASERTQIYVSRGTGFWGPPFRIGAPPEITEITLRRATD